MHARGKHREEMPWKTNAKRSVDDASSTFQMKIITARNNNNVPTPEPL